MSLKAFLLCAGEGARFRPHTKSIPKPLIPFLNLPLCAYNLYLLKTLGVQNIIANVHTHPALLKTELKNLAQQTGFSPPTFSFEKSLLGSAGGLLKVKGFFNPSEPFFYLNGDSFIWLNTKEELSDFYLAHVQSKALVSFLVWPAHNLKPNSSLNYTKNIAPLLKKGLYINPQKPVQKGYIYAKEEKVCSFSTPPTDNKKAKPYEFSGLALFSPAIFNKIEQQKKIALSTQKQVSKSKQASYPHALHIFKDVLSPLVFKEHIRVHSIPNKTQYLTKTQSQQTKVKSCSHLSLPPTRWVDMNQLGTYLEGTKLVLNFLQKQRGKGFLQNILDFYTPHWRRYEGDNYFSAQLVKNPSTEGILFCGPKVRGLNRLSVKGFAVLGEEVFIEKTLFIQQSVLGKKVCLNTNLQNSLKL